MVSMEWKQNVGSVAYFGNGYIFGMDIYTDGTRINTTGGFSKGYSTHIHQFRFFCFLFRVDVAEVKK